MGRIKNFFLKLNKNGKKDKKEDIDQIDSVASDNILEHEVKVLKSIQNKTVNAIMDDCRQIIETTRTLDELKGEYQAVTAYLTDIQKIELMPEEDRDKVNDLARRIQTLNKDKTRYQKGVRKINDIQYKHMAKYEDVLPVQIKEMQNHEKYQETIKTDMKYLEREKEDLFEEQEEIFQKQSYLKGIAITTCVLVILLFLLFVGVNNASKVDMVIPFMLTIIMALSSALYIFMNALKNRKGMKTVELKLNRAILLLNKVKIKYINNTNALEYSYQKFMVESHEQLKSLWEEYLKAKNDEERYELSSNLLDISNRELIRTLRNYNISDSKIWVYQTTALIDNKEMVEVRHRLNVRRQKLRENIDYNNGLRDKSIKEVGIFIEKKPENREEVVKFLKSYGIDL
ncbi:MAG: putative rane protein [Anaerocolumna sp.]|jgi:hypothetical protein|nr:putative rane protein [Anaerocolumna sp.]